MTNILKKPETKPETEGAERSPATEEADNTLDEKAREAEAHLRRAEAALRGQPDDGSDDDVARGTPEGKDRS